LRRDEQEGMTLLRRRGLICLAFRSEMHVMK
jgi:hypothetical protein